jgi:2-dehydropantoate 2-reductase
MQTALTTPGSPLTASMLRDITAGNRIEAEQIIGDLLARAKAPSPLLEIIDVHLKAYEAMR